MSRLMRLTLFESQQYDCPHGHMLRWLCGVSRDGPAPKPCGIDARTSGPTRAPPDRRADSEGRRAESKPP